MYFVGMSTKQRIALMWARAELVKSIIIDQLLLSFLVSDSVISPTFIEEVNVSNSVALFLLHNATQSMVVPQYIVCLSVQLSVTFRYVFLTGWNTSKII